MRAEDKAFEVPDAVFHVFGEADGSFDLSLKVVRRESLSHVWTLVNVSKLQRITDR
jgi:hypothetical protein